MFRALMTFDNNNNNNLLHLYSALHFLVCFSLLQWHPRCRCLCFRSSFNFDILRSNRSCLSVI